MADEVKLTNKERMRRFVLDLRASSPADWGKLLAMVIPVVHLILTPTHVAALLKLEDQICGFVMFLSVLIGLTVLFGATRISDENPVSKILLLVFLLVDVALIFVLLGIYNDALANQQTLREPEVVVGAVTLCHGLIISYGVCAVFMVLSFFIHGKKRV